MWNVNSTATGGGVAEMLRSLLGYVHDAVVRARFLGDRHLAQYADLLESVLR